ncbi:polysaccharide biosynthesis/export family protein [Paracoccus nototheniae]|uniref:Polysaccharide biosynthesis/export family protein n=1 Tax=Paracoccus nototheniae TaxID=2489002 RepID=A0ABW4E4P8_9RHOB|nr:polysaccharide biosynthesis/export family protein [Paracoccus nototheniae]
MVDIVGPRTLRLAKAMGCLLVLGGAAGAQEHVVSPGETLEILVFRVPELTREAIVNVDGAIAFPPLGQVHVAGRTADQIGGLIQQRLTGLEIMLEAQVTVGIVTVRPVVIGGDVAEPGAIPYDQDMTVRRAIALAGGLGALRPAMGAAAALGADAESAAAELVSRHAALARAQAELEGLAELTVADLPSLGGGDTAPVLALANRLLAAAREESVQQKQFLQRDLEIIDDRIARLAVQREYQKNLVDQQTEEATRYSEMQKRGLTPQTRVSEEYRTLIQLQGNLAETDADAADVERQRAAALHELDRHDARRAAALEAEVEAVMTEIATLEASLKGSMAQLVQLGIAGDGDLTVTVYRQTEDGQEMPVPATEGTMLRPGDLVEVKLPDSYFGVSTGMGPAAAPTVTSELDETTPRSSQHRANR